jgi:serine/threonine-protein kinase 40
MSPEITNKRSYLGAPSDIWAAGVLFYTLLCGQFPFRGLSDRDLSSNITSGQVSFPQHVSKEVQSIIASLLEKIASSRPTAA